MIGKGCENAAVYTYHAHHGQTGYGNKRSAINAGNTLNRLAVVVDLVLDNSTRI